MSLKREVAAWVCVLALSLFSKSVYDARRRAEGREQIERAARVEAEVDLRKARTKVDTVYAVDTIPFWRTVRRTETIIDTLLHSDTVTLTQRESVLVFVADSAINQCKNIVTICEQRVAIRDSLLTVISADRDYFKKKAQPSLITQGSSALKWLAIGAGFTLLLTR